MTKLAIFIGLFVAVCSLPAQEPVGLHANIPFDFRVGEKLIPSGEYLVQLSGSAVIFRKEEGQLVGASLLTNGASRGTSPNTGELWFNRYGNEYFLASVWVPYSKQGRTLMKTNREKYLALHTSTSVETASVVSK